MELLLEIIATILIGLFLVLGTLGMLAGVDGGDTFLIIGSFFTVVIGVVIFCAWYK